MFEYSQFYVGTLGGLALGILGTLLSLNRTYDSEKRQAAIEMIDQLVNHFHHHYSATNKQISATNGILDYQLKSLIDDTLLIPIIGKKTFEDTYTPALSDFYLLSLPSPSSLSSADREAHLESINNVAVVLKKVVNCKSGSFRFRSRA